MQYNYQTQQLLDKGVNFATIYPEKQGVVKEMTGFDFDLQNIVSFLQKETENFTIVLPLALEIDKNIISIYNKYQTSQGKKTEPKPEPKAEAKEEMIFTVEDKDGNIKHTGKSLNGASDFYSIHKDEGYEIFVKEGDKPKRKLSGTPEPDAKPSVAILTGRLKLIKKMYAKTPTVVLKGRIKIIEKMLLQPEKFCCGDRMETGGFINKLKSFFSKQKPPKHFNYKIVALSKEGSGTLTVPKENLEEAKEVYEQLKADSQFRFVSLSKSNEIPNMREFRQDSWTTIEHHGGQTEYNTGGYIGKTPEQVWEGWNNGQRLHFLIDHTERKQYTPATQEELSKKSYNFLPVDFKKGLEKHITMGQYDKGGPVDYSMDSSVEKLNTGGEVETEYKRLNSELSKTERGTPERMAVLGKINMLKHQNPDFKPRFDGGGKPNTWGGEPGERFFDVTDEDIENLKNGDEQVELNHWVLLKVGDQYEATRDGLYMEVFATLEDMLNRVDQVAYYEYNEKLSDENGEETFTNEKGEVREYSKGGKVPAKVCSLQNKPKIYNYKGVKVQIRPASKTSKKYIVWDLKTDQIFANEKFNSIDDAKAFVKENKMKLVK